MSIPADTPARPVPLSDRVRVEQIRSIYRNTSPGLTGTGIASIFVTFILYDTNAVSARAALIFSLATIVHVSARLLLFRRYRRSSNSSDWRRWAFYFSLGTLAGGLTLGLGSFLLMSPDRLDMQLLLLLLICGVASGAVTAFGAYPPAFYLFFIPVGVLPVAWILARGDKLHLVLGAIVIIWFVAVAEQARRNSAAFLESVRLRFENLDLIEQLRHEKAVAERANTAKSRFLAAASHDLRQPAHALSLFVAALRSHPTDAEVRGLIDHIDESVRAMGSLFGGLLDISQLDAGVVEVNRAAFELQPLLERICRDYEEEARAKGVRLKASRTSITVVSDPLLLERVLRNIIANAVSYTERGKILVGCRRARRLSIQVWDTGCGIPAAEQEHIFQEFYQLGNPERDRAKGVGLGLAIVMRLTTLLDHPLKVVSTPGRGSGFFVEVPLADPAAEPISSAGHLSSSQLARGAGLILVVDDEVAIQTGMKCLLQSWGYDAIATGSGQEMLERVATQSEVPKLIICDYRLREPENGITVIKRLRSEYNDEVPGMLITGDTGPDRLKEARESGFFLLHKPVANSKLRAAIAHLTSPAVN